MNTAKISIAVLATVLAGAALATTGEALHGAALQAARKHAISAKVLGELTRACPASAPACVVKLHAQRKAPVTMWLKCQDNREAYLKWLELPTPRPRIPASVEAYRPEHLGWNSSGTVVVDPKPGESGTYFEITLTNNFSAPVSPLEKAKVARMVFWYRCVPNRGASALPAQ